MQIHIDVMEDRAGRSYFVVSCEEKGGKVYTRHLTYDQMMEVLSRNYNNRNASASFPWEGSRKDMWTP